MVKEYLSKLKKTQIFKFIKKLIFFISEDEVNMLAGQVTYRFILAFFPFLIFLISLTGLTPIAKETIFDNIGEIIPGEAYSLVEGIITDVFENGNGTLLSIGMISTIWIASSGLVALIRGINKAFGIKDKRTFLKRRGLAILATFWLGVGIVFSMVLIVFGKLIGEYVFELIGVSNIFNIIWEIVRYLLFLLMVTFLISTIYYTFPNKKMNKKDILPGAIFSTIGWVIISTGFSFYINNFSNYSNTYGSIAGIIILILWLYWLSIILLIGAEINMVYIEKRKKNPRL